MHPTPLARSQIKAAHGQAPSTSPLDGEVLLEVVDTLVAEPSVRQAVATASLAQDLSECVRRAWTSPEHVDANAAYAAILSQTVERLLVPNDLLMQMPNAVLHDLLPALCEVRPMPPCAAAAPQRACTS